MPASGKLFGSSQFLLAARCVALYCSSAGSSFPSSAGCSTISAAPATDWWSAVAAWPLPFLRPSAHGLCVTSAPRPKNRHRRGQCRRGHTSGIALRNTGRALAQRNKALKVGPLEPLLEVGKLGKSGEHEECLHGIHDADAGHAFCVVRAQQHGEECKTLLGEAKLCLDLIGFVLLAVLLVCTRCPLQSCRFTHGRRYVRERNAGWSYRWGEV